MLALARRRVGDANVEYVEADIFRWAPRERYDVVFFAGWLSHMPPERFAAFWALVATCLEERGRVFLIDELPAVAAHERLIGRSLAPTVERPLTTGERYRAVKVLYEPDALRWRLGALGWDVDVRPAGWRFFSATAVRRRMGDPGLEPGTSSLSERRSNRLS
jgi:hypothetical protein